MSVPWTLMSHASTQQGSRTICPTAADMQEQRHNAPTTPDTLLQLNIMMATYK